MPLPIRPGFGTLTVRDLLIRGVKLFGPRVFAQRRLPTGDFHQTTYGRLWEQVECLGTALIILGVRKGTRVSIIGENRVEWAVSYLAVLCAGGTCVPLDPKLKEKEIASILEQAGTEIVLAAPSFMPLFPPLKSRLPKLRHVISMEAADAPGVLSWEQVMAKGADPDARSAFEAVEIALDDLAVLLFTSGTSGKAKAVMLTHRNLGSNVNQTYMGMPFYETDVFLSLLPLHHTFEATAGMLVPIASGASITYARSYKSKDIIEDLRDAGVTMMLGVPLVFEKMLAGIKRAIADAPLGKRIIIKVFRGFTHITYVLTGANPGDFLFASLRRKAGLHTVRMLVSGAAPLKPEISREFYYLGLRLLQGYGLTETSPIVSVNPLDRVKFASSGSPIPGVEIRIADPDADGVGEITIRGENVTIGYLGDPAQTASVLKDGWFYTGDAGWLDRDGYVYITGRVKNVIVTAAGKNVHPEEVEAELDASPVIAEAAVMSMRDAGGRETVGAVIYPDYEYLAEDAARAGEPLSDGFVEHRVREAVNDACRALADYKRVKIIKIRKDEFPKTTTLKIKRYLFKDGEQVGEG